VRQRGDWTALKADIDESAGATLHSTPFRPFPKSATGKVAVNVVNHYGDEVLKVYGQQSPVGVLGGR
jgi:adenine-specific DNA-methyltransferase